MASVFVGLESPGSEWPIIEGWLEGARARCPDPPGILEPGEVLFVARRFEGLIAKPVGAATARLTMENEAEVILAGGGMDAARPIFAKAVKWARFQGAKALIAEGRKGWGRALGFPVQSETLTHAYYRLEL